MEDKVCPASECSFIFTEFPPVINKTFDKMDMSGMRMAYDDINDIRCIYSLPIDRA